MKKISQNHLKEMFLKAFEFVEKEKEEINKINVFPVPDQDTGTNLAKTLEGIKKAIEKGEFRNVKEISEAILEAALISAQGNAGVIFTGFLTGFLPKLTKNPIGTKDLAEAFLEGKKRAWQSMMNPKEGTILDAIDAATIAFEKEAKREENIVKIFQKAIEKTKEAVLATREKMEILKKANVVDAGALGFLIILEGYLKALQPSKEREKEKEKPSEKIKKFVQVLRNRYEIVALLERVKFPEKEIREKLKKLGNCLDIISFGGKTKIHIHTDFPDEVRDKIAKMGKILDLKIQDMAKEISGEDSVKTVSVGIVVEGNVVCLPEKIKERYQIETVQAPVSWPQVEKIPGKNIYQKMREIEKIGIKNFPKTSQPSPKAYLEAFKKQLEKFEKVLCVTISSKLSGCFNSACQAKNALPEKERKRVFIFDTLHAAASQALFVLRAIELIQEKREIEEIIFKLKKLIPKTHLFLLFEDPKWIVAGGRLSKRKGKWIERMKKLGFYPLITIKEGVLKSGGIVLAKSEAEALFKKIKKESKKERKEGKLIRAVIQHADNESKAKNLKKLLKEIGIEVSFLSLASPVIGAHTGPGTLICGFQPVE